MSSIPLRRESPHLPRPHNGGVWHRARTVAVAGLALTAAFLAWCVTGISGEGTHTRAVSVGTTGRVVSTGVDPIVAGSPPTITPTPEPTTVMSAPLPESVRLEVPNHQQERNLNCELRSAADLALYYRREITWEQLFEQVGHDPNGDPEVGFVGRSIDDPSGGIFPDGYGVHAAPVARGLRELGIDTALHRGRDQTWLKERLAAGQPVIVWATAGMIESRRVEWQTRDGRTVWGVPWEHTFTAVGYDAAGVWLNDPFAATTDYYGWEQFESRWTLLDNMAVTIEEQENEH